MPDEVWRRRTNRFKGLLADGQPAVAYFATIPWPASIQIAGGYGMDAVIIDLEHTSIGIETLEHMLAAAELGGVSTLVRPAGLDPATVSRILDSGAQGILFPHIETAEEASLARRSMCYPPSGIRGWGGAHTRYAVWQGASVLDGDLPVERGVYSDEYVSRTADYLMTGFLIESVRGVANIDAILQAGEPDVVMFGRGDFSVEVAFDPEACDQAWETVYDACRQRGVGLSLATAHAATRFYPGCFVTVGLDALWLSAAIEQAVRIGRASVPSHG
jgi:2-keto-3-deoxy-L-rhamnonate aldolase RhmA